MVFTSRQTNIRVLADLADGLRPIKTVVQEVAQTLICAELKSSNFDF